VKGFGDRLRDTFGADRVQEQAALAPLTTLRVGGPADWLVTLRSADELKRAVHLAREDRVPVTVLGGGSNVLIADAGIRGMVVRVHGGEVRSLSPHLVRSDAGVTINGLVRWTVGRGVSGLELWAGTPGTVGGAIYGNAHFQGRLVSELIESVELVAREGEVRRVPASEMEFAYDYSRLHRTGEIVVSADFHVGEGDPERLRETARQSLAFRKRTQPLHLASAGCIFQNPQPGRDRVPEGTPWSAGALVDLAGLKDAAEGGARVSSTHANFIVHDGAATAADIVRLIGRCRAAVKAKFGIELRDEIVRLGFGEEAHVDTEG
jgi:UDP-N-acetylmuramate dehydrogenase